MAHWLLVERKENWEIDRNEGFTRFGVSHSKLTLASQIKKGDLLIFYISSGISKLSDIREAIESGTKKLSLGGNYDTAFSMQIFTRPYLTLPREKWVSVEPLVKQLSFINKRGEWGYTFRNSLRQLNEADATLLIKTMQASNQAKGS